MEKKRLNMPTKLTSEDGHKSLLIGEFNVKYTIDCPECGGTGCYVDSSCYECGGNGKLTEKITIPWTTIKEIYSKIVEFEIRKQV